MNLTCVLMDFYKLRLTYVPCLLALVSKYPLLPYLCPSNESFWQKHWHWCNEILLSWSQRKYSGSFRTHLHPTHCGTVLKANWYPDALKKSYWLWIHCSSFVLALDDNFPRNYQGNLIFSWLEFTVRPKQSSLSHSLTYQCSLSRPASANQWWESCVCTTAEIETHYSTYLYLLVIQRTEFGFQKRKSIYRREA